MEIKTRQYKRVDVVEVSGRVDSAAAPQLEAALQAILTQERFHIVVDMTGLTYLSSAGMRVLVSVLKQTRRWNRGDLRLAKAAEPIKGVLQLAGLDALFKMYDDMVEAVGSF